MRYAMHFALLSLCMLSVGCVALVAGAGAGAGAYSYVKGDLTRSYQAEYDNTVRAAGDTLRDLKIDIDSEVSDGITTTFKALRADGTPVTVRLERLAPKLTDVSVRSGRVGIWDKKVSKLIHDLIEKHLRS